MLKMNEEKENIKVEYKNSKEKNRNKNIILSNIESKYIKLNGYLHHQK